MKVSIFAIALVLGFGLAGAPRAMAADEAGVKVATVDRQKALQTVESGKKAKAQLEAIKYKFSLK